ncbi:hypothetical protein ACM66B_000986 [Microbotryomycetes sp. NB124-2]
MPDARSRVNIYGSPVGHSLSPIICNHVFKELGLTRHEYGAVDCPSLLTNDNAWSRDLRSDTLLGTCLTMPLKLQAMSLVPSEYIVDDHAKVIGSVNTTWAHGYGGDFKATNLDWKSVLNCLVTALTSERSPYPEATPMTFEEGKVAGFVIGAGGAARAAIYALQRMRVNPVLVVNRDRQELKPLVREWKGTVTIVPVFEAMQLRDELERVAKAGSRIAVAVSCIPSELSPVTEEEKKVWDLAREVFVSQTVQDGNKQCGSAEFLAVPKQPILLDMAYKPPMTPMRSLAEKHGWTSVCGAQAVLEVCFEQCDFWLEQSVPRGVRDSARTLIESRIQ